MKNFNDFKTQYADYLKDNVFYLAAIAFGLALSRSFAYNSIHLGTAGSAYALNTWIVETLQHSFGQLNLQLFFQLFVWVVII